MSIAAVGVWLSQGPTPRVSPVLGLWFVAVPVFDLFSTIIRRVLEGKSPFVPDHGHLHHVLTDAGLSSGSTLVWMLFVAAACATIGIVGDLFELPDGVMLIGWFVAGNAYYQMLRHPRIVVESFAAARSATRPSL
jgi:UDP-GlcNAc:undecaprenyl-phosphate GlcNAc-1-phosphate transferase